jgi:fluoroquinolone resistance protein
MANVYFKNKTYSNKDFSKQRLPVAEYDQCIFKDCTFEQGDLSNCTFIECEFINCNLSSVLTKYTCFQEVEFTECKILGVTFNQCNHFLLSIRFNSCLLNLSSFHQLKLVGTLFSNCKLHEVDFTESNLKKVNFDNCELNKAVFDQSNLELSDCSTAVGFEINPTLNRLQNAKFSKHNLEGLLATFKIKIE